MTATMSAAIPEMLIPQRLAARDARRVVYVGTHQLVERDLHELEFGQTDVLEKDVEARRPPAFVLLDEPRRLVAGHTAVADVDAREMRRPCEPSFDVLQVIADALHRAL